MHEQSVVSEHICVIITNKSVLNYRSNQWSTTGLSKSVVCTVLSMEMCI